MLYRLQNIFATNKVTTGFTEEICIATGLSGALDGILAISLGFKVTMFVEMFQGQNNSENRSFLMLVVHISFTIQIPFQDILKIFLDN